MKPITFMSLILATLVLFSTTDVRAKLVPVEDSIPQTSAQLPTSVRVEYYPEADLESIMEDDRKETIEEIFQNANSLINPPLTVTDDLKRLEELQRLKAEVAEELKHLDRLRQLKVAIAEELGRL